MVEYYPEHSRIKLIKALNKPGEDKMRYEDLKQNQFGVWYNPKDKSYRVKVWTIFTKDNLCKKGEYADELDIEATTPGKAKNIAKVVLEHDYTPELRISKANLCY